MKVSKKPKLTMSQMQGKLGAAVSALKTLERHIERLEAERSTRASMSKRALLDRALTAEAESARMRGHYAVLKQERDELQLIMAALSRLPDGIGTKLFEVTRKLVGLPR